MKIDPYPYDREITRSLYRELIAYARQLANQKRDLGFDDDSAADWVHDAIIITLDPNRTTVRISLKNTLMYKIRGKASDATDKALRYRARLKRYQNHLDINENFCRSTYEACSPGELAEILEVISERVDRWDDLS